MRRLTPWLLLILLLAQALLFAGEAVLYNQINKPHPVQGVELQKVHKSAPPVHV